MRMINQLFMILFTVMAIVSCGGGGKKGSDAQSTSCK